MTKNTSTTQLPADRIAHATFALMAADREERASDADPRSVEVILGAVGFTPGEVQSLTGGNYQTIQSCMRRGK
jgi:hypothetical protein